jgi:hypothetical protein
MLNKNKYRLMCFLPINSMFRLKKNLGLGILV